MSRPDDNLLDLPQTLINGELNRRTFLLGTAALLTLPALTNAQTGKHQKARSAPAKVKPYLMAQLGHSGLVASVTFSPDGKYLLTIGGTSNHTAILWETATGKQIRNFEHPCTLYSVAFSPDSRYILTGDEDKTAILWEIETGKQIRKFDEHPSSVYSVAFSPDGKHILTGSYKAAFLWQAETGKLIRKFEGHSANDFANIFSVAFSLDGKFVLTGGQDNIAFLWQAETGKLIRKFEGHTREIKSVAFSPDGRYILTGGDDKSAILWQAETGKLIRKFEDHSSSVYSVAFSPDGKQVLTGSDKIAWLWQAETGKQIRQFEVHTGFINSVAFSPDGGYILTGGPAIEAILWQTETGKQIRKFAGRSAFVQSVAFSPDGRYMLTGGWDNTASLWQAEAGKQIRKFVGHTAFIQSVAFSPDSKYVLTGSSDTTAILWQAETGKRMQTFQGHAKWVTSVAFSPDGKYVLTGDEDKTAILWEIETGKQVRMFAEHPSSVYSVAFSPDGKQVLTGSDKIAWLWQIETGKQIRKFEGHSAYILSVAFSPDGKYILTGGYDDVIQWQAETGKQIRKFGGANSWAFSVAFSPDGKRVLTANANNAAYLWEAETGKQIRSFEGHSNMVLSAAFSPDGKYVLTGSWDSTTRLWQTSTGKELCSLIGFKDGTWAVTDREGRYDASNGGDVEGLHWVVRNQTVDLKQLKQRYYTPGLMAKLFKGEKLANVQAFDNVPMYPEVTLPERMPESGKVAITLLNQDGGIGKVQILLNGKEVQGDARGARPNPNAEKLTLPFDLAPYRALLVPGQENTLEVIAYNGEGWLASRGVKCAIPPQGKPAEPPLLYAIIGGINDYAAPELHLRFAAHDAESFATALSLGAKRLFGADSVELVRLTGMNGTLLPTRANFEKAFQNARKLKAQDVFVVYLAGHGVALGKGADLYCYLTQEAKAADSTTLSDLALRQKTTITSEELTDWTNRIPALKQVMILDTCAAGAAAVKLTEKRDVNGDQVRALDRLKDRTGFQVLMGCAADRVSYEATRYGQGVLTYALLQGMKGLALGEGGQVDVSRLFQYAVENVPRLAGDIGGVQSPQVCAPRAVSFPMGRMEKEDLEKVPLEKSYPLILRPNLTDPDAAFDSLKLGPAVRKRLNDLLTPETRGKADTAIVVYVDAEEMPGAITPNGIYTIQGDTVKVRIVLRQDEKTVETLTVEGKKSDFEALVSRITRAIAEAAQKH